MNYILQIDAKLNKDIQTYGCFFMVMVTMAQMIAGKTFDQKGIEWLWSYAKKSRWLDTLPGGDEYNLLNPPALANLALLDLETPKTVSNVMAVDFFPKKIWKPAWYGGHDYSVLLGETESGGTHYRLGNKDGLEIYNPFPGIKIVRELQISYYKVA